MITQEHPASKGEIIMGAGNKIERGFTLTRILDAPREIVFRAWTDPRYLQWFFNDQAPIPDDPIVVDLRVGGVWRQKMIESDNTAYFTGGIYREIVPGEKLVFIWGASDGWPKLDVDHLEDSPVVTVLLHEIGEHGEKTEMILRFELPEHLSEERVREWIACGCREGWAATFDRLVASFADTGKLEASVEG
jgi:uncharacterized protein YndB with AHSA1/START domain